MTTGLELPAGKSIAPTLSHINTPAFEDNLVVTCKNPKPEPESAEMRFLKQNLPVPGPGETRFKKAPRTAASGLV